MSKGDELLQKRRDLLKHLYEKGAIAPHEGGMVKGEMVLEALQVDKGELVILWWSLKNQELIGGDPGGSLWLTGRGFTEAAAIVRHDTSPIGLR